MDQIPLQTDSLKKKKKKGEKNPTPCLETKDEEKGGEPFYAIF